MAEVEQLFKALADVERLRIAALLGGRDLTVSEIAAESGLAPAVAARHVVVMREAGLVEAALRGERTAYHFARRPLLDALRALDGDPGREEAALTDDLDAYDRKVLGDFLRGGRLTAIPAQQKKRDAVLRFLAARFAPGRDYPEREVNALLAAYHDDYATLRRALVDARLLDRERGVYRRIEPVGPTVEARRVGEDDAMCGGGKG